MGTQFSPPKKGQSPQFSTHVYCGQTAAWIKIPLGTEVGLGLGHIVLDGDSATPPKRGLNLQLCVYFLCDLSNYISRES